MADSKEIGKLGEDLSVDFLINKSYKIVKRNWRFGHLELDLIAIDGANLVFVEVKTRSADYLVEPELSLTKKQQRFLIQAANAFIDMHAYDMNARFDIISVVIHPEGHLINHIEDAFFPYNS
jgi:putative endonuclease